MISSLLNLRSIRVDRISSLILRETLRSGERKVFLTNCWVIVEPPRALPMPISLRTALIIPPMSKP